MRLHIYSAHRTMTEQTLRICLHCIAYRSVFLAATKKLTSSAGSTDGQIRGTNELSHSEGFRFCFCQQAHCPAAKPVSKSPLGGD